MSLYTDVTLIDFGGDPPAPSPNDPPPMEVPPPSQPPSPMPSPQA